MRYIARLEKQVKQLQKDVDAAGAARNRAKQMLRGRKKELRQALKADAKKHS